MTSNTQPTPKLSKQFRNLARMFVEFHEHGPSYSGIFRINAPWSMLRYSPLLPALWIAHHYGDGGDMTSLLMVLAWFLYVDLVIFPRAFKRFWPLYDRFLKWDEVRRVAEGEQVSKEPFGPGQDF